jgi:hypothetical protein
MLLGWQHDVCYEFKMWLVIIIFFNDIKIIVLRKFGLFLSLKGKLWVERENKKIAIIIEC